MYYTLELEFNFTIRDRILPRMKSFRPESSDQLARVVPVKGIEDVDVRLLRRRHQRLRVIEQRVRYLVVRERNFFQRLSARDDYLPCGKD